MKCDHPLGISKAHFIFTMPATKRLRIYFHITDVIPPYATFRCLSNDGNLTRRYIDFQPEIGMTYGKKISHL